MLAKLLSAFLALHVVTCFECGLEPEPNASERFTTRHPWSVLIGLKRGATFFSKASQRLCGGVILDDEHVLTSPDCTLEEGKEEDLAVLYVGYHDVEQIIAKRQQIEEYEKEHGEVESLSDLFRYASRSDSEKKKEWEFQTIHLSPSMNVENRPGVIKLDLPLKFGSRIQPICLPKNPEDVPDELTLVGWANPKNTKEFTAGDTEREVTFNLKGGKSDPSLVVCGSDQGSPVVYKKDGRWTLAGIVNFENPKSSCVDVYSEKSDKKLFFKKEEGKKFWWLKFLD